VNWMTISLKGPCPMSVADSGPYGTNQHQEEGSDCHDHTLSKGLHDSEAERSCTRMSGSPYRSFMHNAMWPIPRGNLLLAGPRLRIRCTGIWMRPDTRDGTPSFSICSLWSSQGANACLSTTRDARDSFGMLVCRARTHSHSLPELRAKSRCRSPFSQSIGIIIISTTCHAPARRQSAAFLHVA
jgi:hypothetical protein